jgi:N-acetylneuraminate lyase
MNPHAPLHGLICATHTPFHTDGSLNLDPIESQAAHLLKNGVTTAFIGGSTGESASLTLTERLALAEHWFSVTSGSPLRIVVHVGANCLHDARTLAAQAGKLGAAAISALAPSYFKPRSTSILIDTCAAIASAAPDTPFYYYDIPALTGINLSPEEFLNEAPARIPNLAGIKYTNADLMTYQYCLRSGFDVPYGLDEHFLGALAMGAKGAVGSGFNFAAPIYLRLLDAFARGDLESARTEQFRGVQIIRLLASHGYMAAAKTTMSFLGVPVGPPRLPNPPLSPEASASLRSRLESLGFFDWIR